MGCLIFFADILNELWAGAHARNQRGLFVWGGPLFREGHTDPQDALPLRQLQASHRITCRGLGDFSSF